MEETKIAMKLEEETKGIKKMCEQLGDSIKHEFDKGIEQIDTAEMKEAIDMLKDLYETKKSIIEACYYKIKMEEMEMSEDEEGEDDGRRGYRGQPRDSMGRFTSRRGRGGRRGYMEPMYYMPLDMYHNYSAEELRDMDRADMNRMYYADGGSSGGSSGGGGSQGGGQSSSGGSSGGSGGGSRGYSEGNQSEGGNYSSRMQRDEREGRSGEKRKGYMEAKEQGKEKQEKMKELENYTKELAEDVTEMISGASPEEKNLLKTKMQTLIQKIQ